MKTFRLFKSATIQGDNHTNDFGLHTGSILKHTKYFYVCYRHRFTTFDAYYKKTVYSDETPKEGAYL